MVNILEEKFKIREKEILESKIKNLKINSKSKLIKNIGHTTLKLFPLTAATVNVVSIMSGEYYSIAFLMLNSLCFYINYKFYKGEWKDYFNDKKNLKILKQDLKELKDNINLIDTEATLIFEEDIESYQKYKK